MSEEGAAAPSAAPAEAEPMDQDAPAEGSDAHADASGPGAGGSASAGDGGGDALDPEEMIDPIVDGAKLVEIEEMGFPRARAYRALALSGTTTVEGAVNWIIEHSEDADIDEPPPKVRRGDVEKAKKPKMSKEEAKAHAKTMVEDARIRREKEEREANKARAIAMREGGKEMARAKRELDEAERKRSLIERQRAKEEEERAREKIRKKIAQDKAERRVAMGLPAELTPEELEKERQEERRKAEEKAKQRAAFVPVKPAQRLIELRELARAMKKSTPDEAAFKTCCNTLLKLLGNVARSPEEDKFRVVKLGNAAIQKRIVAVTNGVEFLVGSGFERGADEGGEEVLTMERQAINMELINGAGEILQNALTNPMFGVL